MYRAPRLAASALLALALAAPGCKYPYPGDVEDAANACAPSTTTCTNDTLTVCDATGQPSSTTTCAFGCFTSGDRCADLAPSNGLGMYLDQARTAQSIVLTQPATLDTDAATLMTTVNVPMTTVVVPSQPVDVLVVIASSFEADNVLVYGSRALAIVSDGDVRLHGMFSVSARDSALAIGGVGPGAGASTQTDPACTAGRSAFSATSYAGAGGGGHGTAGGRGGNGDVSLGGARGEVTGSEALVPLRGGCPGAQAWTTPGTGSSQGHGGGAIQVSTRGHIVLDSEAAITASGSGPIGFPRSCPIVAGDPPYCNAGAGGGAGGGILLEAAGIDVPVTAAVVANGGSGNCSYMGYGGSGLLSEGPTQGQDCSTIEGAGSGGRSSNGVLAALDGGNGTVTGGGGGGGAGRIRINLPAGVTFDPGPPIVSPPPSLGRAATR